MGMGKTSLEQKITEEAKVLCAEIGAKCGEPFQPRSLLYVAISNVICSTIFGHRFEYSDPWFKSAVSIIAATGRDEAGLIADLPLWFFKKTKVNLQGVRVFIEQEIAQHEQDFDNNEPRDVVDMFLAEIEMGSGEKTSLKKESFWCTIFDLFSGGTETNTSYISWVLLILAGNVQVREKVRQDVFSY